MTIAAIETEYAGYRFRSRLEARWAVFFDRMGIKWRYESQGYEIPIDGNGKTRRYLPDFWIPSWHTWAEVKGSVTGEDIKLLTAASLSLPNPDGGAPALPGIVLLGHIPGGGMHPAFIQFTSERELLVTPCPSGLLAHVGYLGSPPLIEICIEDCLDINLMDVVGEVRTAFDQARRARFEHGETPQPHDVRAEQGVLGLMMAEPEAFGLVALAMRPEDHYRPAHQLIHATIVDLHSRRKPYDTLGLVEFLFDTGNLARCGGAEYFRTLLSTEFPHDPTATARHIADLAAKRAAGK
jgi:hypothetical protein